MKKLIQVIYPILLLIISSYCDEIILKDGESAKTSIVDTMGCQVKILRNGNDVSIKKSLIEKIIWKNDTIDYSGYVCNEKPKQIVRYQDTPEYKLMLVLDNSPETIAKIPEKAKVAYLYSPLQGNYNAEEFVGVQSALIDLLKKKYDLQVLNPSEMLNEITSGKSQYDFAFFVRKYTVDVNIVDQSGTFVSKYKVEKKKELFTTCDIMLYSISRKEVVFHKITVEKRSVWGENEYSRTSILTPAKWKEEWEKDQTERKLDRNANVIIQRLKNEIGEFFEIKE